MPSETLIRNETDRNDCRADGLNTILLAQAAAGDHECVDVEGSGDSAVRLKRLGICSGRRLTVLRSGDPMILRVVGSRIAVSRSLARSVVVAAVSAAAGAEVRSE